MLKIEKQKEEMIEKLSRKFNSHTDINRHLEIANLNLNCGKSYSQLAQDFNITSTRVGEIVRVYKKRMAPVIVIEVLNLKIFVNGKYATPQEFGAVSRFRDETLLKISNWFISLIFKNEEIQKTGTSHSNIGSQTRGDI